MTAVQAGGRILVTGATGFLGAPLVHRLAGDGYRVTALARRTRPPDLPDPVEYLALDLAADGAAQRLGPCRWDAIVHLAGDAPKAELNWDEGAALIASHVRAASSLVALAGPAWTGRLVHASGFIVYGIPARLPVAETHPRAPLHAYALAKSLAEDVLLGAFRESTDRWLLRLPGLFSELRRSGALFGFAAAARAGNELLVEMTRSTPWDVLHLDDAIGMIARALVAPAVDPGPINVSYGEPVDFLSIASRLAAQAGSGAQVRLRGSGKPVPFQMDTTKMLSLLGPLPRTLDERLGAFLTGVETGVP